MTSTVDYHYKLAPLAYLVVVVLSLSYKNEISSAANYHQESVSMSTECSLKTSTIHWPTKMMIKCYSLKLQPNLLRLFNCYIKFFF